MHLPKGYHNCNMSIAYNVTIQKVLNLQYKHEESLVGSLSTDDEC